MALSMQIHFFRCLSKSVGCHQYVPNFKYFWIRSEGGGAEFSNISEIQEFLNYLREGGGGQALIGIFPKFSLFFVTPPISTNIEFFNHIGPKTYYIHKMGFHNYQIKIGTFWKKKYPPPLLYPSPPLWTLSQFYRFLVTPPLTLLDKIVWFSPFERCLKFCKIRVRCWHNKFQPRKVTHTHTWKHVISCINTQPDSQIVISST